jgi:hypothetical protein
MSTLPRTLMVALSLSGVCLAGLLAGCSSSSAPMETSSGGAPMCSSSGKNAFDTYGQEAFLAVNSAIFANVDAEMKANGTKNLGESFTLIGTGKPAATKDDLPTFQGKLGAFLVSAYGGPSSITVDGTTYSGSADLTAAHTGLNITTDQYNYFVMNVVVPALTSSGVKTEDVSSCFAPVVTDPSVVSAIVGH